MLNIFQQGQFGRRKVGGGGGGATDPDFASVVALLHMDGANNGTSFPDSGPLGLTWTRTGANLLTVTGVLQYGTASASWPTSGSGVHNLVATNAGLAFGTGDFTVELWYRRTATAGTYQGLYAWHTSRGLYWQGNEVMFFDNFTERCVISFPNDSAFHHVALTRSGTTIRVFVDGVKAALDATNSFDFNQTSHYIGTDVASGSQSASVHMDDVRVTKGVARYTANFTPPTAAFPNS